MAEKLNFALVSPEREVFHGDVDQVVVPGSEGDFGVLPNHAPVMSVIKLGALRVFNEGAERRIFVNGGFADVTPDGLTVLAEEAFDVAEIDAVKLDADLRDAAEDVRTVSDDAKREAAAKSLARLEAMKATLVG
jgi:F-type H+-transporting ATPase subunit epsilon